MRQLILSLTLLLSLALPAQTPLATAYITGSATETGTDTALHELRPQGTSTGIFECFCQLQVGTFMIRGTTIDGEEICLGSNDHGLLTPDGSPFIVSDSRVVRLRIDSTTGAISITPVELYVKGNIVPAHTTLAYAGKGVFCGDVYMSGGTELLFADKYFYFAFNDNDTLAVKRLCGSRTTMAMPAEGFATEDIRINGGVYALTLDMSNYIWDIDAPIDEYKISAFGSSVCNGEGADDHHGYAYMYNNQLFNRCINSISHYPFTISGIAIGGNTTQDLLRRYDEMLHDYGKYVIIGLSMGNEGIHNAVDQEAIFTQFRDNMLTLIRQMHADGKTVVVMNNYTRGDFNASDYDYVKRMNLLIHQWAVPSVNTLGAIDDGAGHWATGYEADTAHPTTAGHRQFMAAIPPSLFDALENNKPQPVRETRQATRLDHGATIELSGETAINPFTTTVRLRGSDAGDLITIVRDGTEAVVSLTDGGYVQYVGSNGATLTSQKPLVNDDDTWHYITLTNYFAQQRTLIYLDTTCLGEVNEALAPTRIIIGDRSKALTREYSELFFWRSAMNEMEVNAVVEGLMLKSSLDIYSPLSDEIKAQGITNLAQTLNHAVFVPGKAGK